MSHGVPHFVWRDGRPRWEPSKTLRNLGWKGRDLKDGKGNYLSLELALDDAHLINLKACVTQKRRRAPLAELTIPEIDARPTTNGSKQGYVYFLRSGDKYKIGFSSKPFDRMQTLITGNPLGITAVAAVRGTQDEEGQLHALFADLCIHGEWFAAKWRLRQFIANTIIHGSLDFRGLKRTI